MAKTKVSEWDSTPGNNTDIDSINIAEGCAPSGINNAIRELMSQVKDFQQGTYSDPFNGPVNGTIGATTPAAGAFTTLTASSTATLNTLASSGATLTGGSINNMAIGGSTAAAGAFTTLSASGAVTLSGGTANGVAYLNGSKVLTTGSALTFDGTNLGIGATTPLQLLHLSSASPPGMQLTYQGVGASRIGIAAGNALTFGLDTSNGATEQMRLTSTGLGIGTSSPGAKLEVVGGEPRLRNSSNWNYSNLDLIRNSSNTATPRFLAMMLDGDSLSSTTIGAYNAIWGAYDSAPTTGSTSSALNGAMVYGAYAGHRWYTNGTERARIDSSGNLLVGGTTSTYGSKLVLYSSGGGNIIESRQTSTAAQYHSIFMNANGAVGSIQTSGSATSYVTSSDYRLKNTIAPMTGALAKVQALKPCTYKWNADGSDGEGFIAHELAEVVPQCVTGEKDAVDAEGNPVYQGIDTSFLVATLTAALQEAVAEINQLKARLDAANL